HFTDFQIAEFIPGGDLLEKDKVYTYPNPARGDNLYFKYYSGDDSYITIDVYNVAGERVAHLAGTGQAGLVSQIAWDMKRYASGIYIYKIEAKAVYGNSKKHIIKKLAIIK
ncbi:MAG: T9SS type A sorting domain-containing protein, partial [bacterium]